MISPEIYGKYYDGDVRPEVPLLRVMGWHLRLIVTNFSTVSILVFLVDVCVPDE
jgi:hypothetical protein